MSCFKCLVILLYPSCSINWVISSLLKTQSHATHLQSPAKSSILFQWLHYNFSSSLCLSKGSQERKPKTLEYQKTLFSVIALPHVAFFHRCWRVWLMRRRALCLIFLKHSGSQVLGQVTRGKSKYRGDRRRRMVQTRKHLEPKCSS